jgi:hypothetical protein
MRNPKDTDLKSTSDNDLNFSLPEESRWLEFWENLKGLFVKAVASSVSATRPRQICSWQVPLYSTILEI